MFPPPVRADCNGAKAFKRRRMECEQKVGECNVPNCYEMAELMRLQLMCLQEIHLKCVIHADIKPSNIFLHVQNGSYQVYLIDFGYALIVNERRVSSQHEPSSGSAAAIRGGTILFSSINWQHDRRTWPVVLLLTPSDLSPQRSPTGTTLNLSSTRSYTCVSVNCPGGIHAAAT